MNRSDEIDELAAALAKAQAAIKDAELDKTNLHFGNPYSTLSAVWEACRKPLTDAGLAVTQLVEVQDGKLGVKTMLLHASGQFLCSFCPAVSQQQGMQALGSAITYAKRYSLAAIAGVASGEEKEDDDGNRANGRRQGTNKQESRGPKPKGKERAAEPPKEDAELKASEFVMPFGKTTGGKALKDCDLGDLQKALTWLKEQDQEKLGTADLAAKDAIQAYFYELETQGVKQ